MDSIIVGVDGSDSAKEALAWAIDEARHHDASVTAVLVAEPPYLYGSELPYTVTDDTIEQARAELDDIIAEVAGDLGTVTLGARVETGDPRRVLRELSQQADHLVVGTRGHSEVIGLLLGSVSQYLATHSACPVTLVRGARQR
jgi:nucleotide-binding universal stress UspA family protein